MRYLQIVLSGASDSVVVAHEWKSRRRDYQGKYLNRKFTVDGICTISRVSVESSEDCLHVRVQSRSVGAFVSRCARCCRHGAVLGCTTRFVIALGHGPEAVEQEGVLRGIAQRRLHPHISKRSGTPSHASTTGSLIGRIVKARRGHANCRDNVITAASRENRTPGYCRTPPPGATADRTIIANRWRSPATQAQAPAQAQRPMPHLAQGRPRSPRCRLPAAARPVLATRRPTSRPPMRPPRMPESIARRCRRTQPPAPMLQRPPKPRPHRRRRRVAARYAAS